jgi:hypothetical protein
VGPPLVTSPKNYGSEVYSNHGRLFDTQAVPAESISLAIIELS